LRPSKAKVTIPDVPKEYDLDYLVFQLTDGDVSKDAAVWDIPFHDCIRYVSFKQYEAMVNERVMNSHG
jgi:hypothetical protein